MRADHGMRIPELDGIRAISILMVIAAHLLPVGPSWMGLNRVAGAGGMSLFFCLSGFLIVSILYNGEDWRAFLIKRVSRIVPALFAYLVIVYIVTRAPPEDLVLNLLFVSNYFYDGLQAHSTSHLWSLCVEMHFYFAIALSVLFFKKFTFWMLPIVTVIITLIRMDNEAYAVINTHLRVDEILSGGCLALIYQNRERIFPNGLTFDHKWSFLVFLILPLWLASAHKETAGLNYFRPYLAASLVGAVIFVGAPFVRKFLISRPMRYIGYISYALYLYHPLAASGYLGQGGVVEKYAFKRPISFLIAWAAAHVSTVYWESIWNRRARSWAVRFPAQQPITEPAK